MYLKLTKKVSKTGFKHRDRSRFCDKPQRMLFYTADLDSRPGTWTINNAILGAEKRMDRKSQVYSYQLFGNWCFRFVLSQSSWGHGLTLLFSEMLAFIRLFQIYFDKRPALAAHPHNKNHFKIVAQTQRRRRGKKTLELKK